MDASTPKLLAYMVELELAAEDILSDRQQIIDLDIRRQQTRQAVRELHKEKSLNKTWMCVGNMFIKMPKQQAKKLLETDFDRLDSEISEIRKNLKPKVNKLRDLEHKDELRGFSLNPLTEQEIDSVKSFL